MNPWNVNDLPIGTLVSHKNTANRTRYRRVAGGTGWLVCNLDGKPSYGVVADYASANGSAVLTGAKRDHITIHEMPKRIAATINDLKPGMLVKFHGDGEGRGVIERLELPERGGYVVTQGGGQVHLEKATGGTKGFLFKGFSDAHTRVWEILADAPAVKVGKKAQRIAELEGEAVEREKLVAELLDTTAKLRDRAQEAERALRAEREKATDLGTALASERTRVANLRRTEHQQREQIANQTATIQRLENELATKVAPTHADNEGRGWKWDEFVRDHGDYALKPGSRNTGAFLDNPLQFLKGYSFTDTRIVALWGVAETRALKAQNAELHAEKRAQAETIAKLQVRTRDLDELEARILNAVRALGGK